MIRPNQLSLISLFLFGVASTGIAADRMHYAIKMKGKVIGYAVVESINSGKSKHVELRSTTVMKMTLLGKPRITRLTSTTTYGRGTQMPVRYQLKTQVNQVIQNVECKFEPGNVERTAFRKGDKPGKPTAIALPKKFHILGGNNFGHWQRLSANLSKSAKPKLSVDIFLPDGGQKTKFKFRQGGKKELIVRGKKLSCVPWHLSPGGLILWNEAATNQFVKMDLPSQQTTIELADVNVVKMFQRAEAAEVLANRFVRSNVLFDDFMKVRALRAKIDVTVGGVENEASVLTTNTQKFTGKKDKSHLVGTVAITTKTYNGKNSPSFPRSGTDRAKNEKWLKPTTYIESNHATIVAKSRELTNGAKNSWDAVERIGRWVQREVAYTIADTPSARLALETRKGDCGPHSTLTVAMLRAAGIPARLVGGLLYTPILGGTFGQHAWVEVYMGKDGWIPIDPTTGEFTRLSAVHIKLFEGVGGVLPKSVKVESYQPANKQPLPSSPRKAKQLAWKPGKKYTYRYSINGKEIGAETFTVKKTRQGKSTIYRWHSSLGLKVGAQSVKSETSFALGDNGRPISYEREYTGSQRAKLKADFAKDEVKVSKKVFFTSKRTVKLPENAMFFDNNLLASFAAICSHLDFKAGETTKIQTFHPNSFRIIALTFDVAKDMEKVNGVDCYKCKVIELNNTFWVSKDGRFVKGTGGPLVMELVGRNKP